MRTLRLLPILAAALAAACEKAPEAEPADAGPLLRDVQVADVQDAPAAPDVADAATDSSTIVDTPSTDAPPPDAAADAPDVPAADGSCVGDGGCYACAPTLPEHFPNRCTASTCAPFDDRARLPRLLPDGGLPPLP